MTDSLTFRGYVARSKPLLTLSLVGFLALGILLISLGNVGLFLWINQYFTPHFGTLSKLLTELGSSWPMIWLIAFTIQKAMRKLVAVFLVWLIGACFSWLFKLWLMSGALRPFKFFLDKGIRLNVVEGVDIHHYNTFPSGHTLTVFSAIFVFIYVRKTPFSGWQSTLFWLLAVGCGLSRIVLVQHWPTDVLGGMGLGILAAYLAVWISIRLPERELLNRNLISFFPF